MIKYQPDLAEVAFVADRGATAAAEVSRIAAERGAGTVAVKARSAERALARAGKAGGPVTEATLRLKARAEAYAGRVDDAKQRAELAGARGTIAHAIGVVPSAYGRAVDAQGEGKADVPVELVTPEGECVARGKTDARGYFAVYAKTEVKTEVVLVVGAEGAARRYPVTGNGRILPSRPIVARDEGRRGTGAGKAPAKAPVAGPAKAPAATVAGRAPAAPAPAVAAAAPAKAAAAAVPEEPAAPAKAPAAAAPEKAPAPAKQAAKAAPVKAAAPEKRPAAPAKAPATETKGEPRKK